MFNLPDEIIKIIFSFLGLHNLANVASISRQFYKLTQEKMDARDELKKYITNNKHLSNVQINYLLSDKIYFKIRDEKLSIESAMLDLDQFFKNQTMRWNALRYQSDTHREEQEQQLFAISKGYLDEKLMSLSSLKRMAILQHDLSFEQVKNLRQDQAELIVKNGFTYENVKNLKAYQAELIKNGWELEEASLATVMQARMENKRKSIIVIDEPTIKFKK